MTGPLRSELSRYLRTETVGGTILLAAAAVALLWANLAADSYAAVRDWTIGPAALHLNLTIGDWTQDGLLAVFFFVAGLELKREFVVGDLAHRKRAALPVVAACGGVVIPAILAAAIGWGTPGMDKAWAIPVATDIAFALGVLSLTGSRMPAGARAFLLSLAVVDDLVAIVLIAVLFTATIAFGWLAAAAAAVLAYAWAQHARLRTPLLYVPLAAFAWYALHASGVHATLAGVLLALATRVRLDPGELLAPATRLEHRLQPLSAAVCVPMFALFAAGVPINADVLGNVFTDPISLAVIVGLLVGKPLGIFGVSRVATAIGLASRPSGLADRDLFALSVLGGIGFTVSLLIAELALEEEPGSAVDTAKVAVLSASLIAGLLGSVLLIRRGRAHGQRLMPPPITDDSNDDEPEGSTSDTPQ